MKKIKSSFAIFFLALLLVSPQSSRAGDFTLILLNTDGEKSKDSWSADTKIEIHNFDLNYSVTFGGSIKSHKKDQSKNCVLSEENLEKIKSIIKEKSLNADDSLFEKDEKYKSFEQFTNISLKIESEGKSSTIRINGDISGFKNEALYNNAEFLISFLEELIEKC